MLVDVDADISEEQMVAMGTASSSQSQSVTFTPHLVVDELAELLLLNGGDEHCRSLKKHEKKGNAQPLGMRAKSTMWPTSSTRPGAADTPSIIILDSETMRKTGATVQSNESKRAHTAAVSDIIGIDRTDADSSWQAYQTRLMFRGWPRQSGIVNRVRPQSRGGRSV